MRVSELVQADKLPGGLADDKTDDPVDPAELDMGAKVELEHTDDPELAREIARDHLVEIPDYYTRLKAMEDKAEAQATFDWLHEA